MRQVTVERGRDPRASALLAFGGVRKVGTAHIPVVAGDRVTILTAGGGGHGDSAKRDSNAIREDQRDDLEVSKSG